MLNKAIPFYLFMALIVVISGFGMAMASDTVEHHSPVIGSTTINEYSRAGSTFQLRTPQTMPSFGRCSEAQADCRNFQPSNVTTTYACEGGGLANHGGWVATAGGGDCWNNMQICYYAGTIDEVCYTINPPDTSEGAEFSASTECTSPHTKGGCSFDYGSNAIVLDTGDDMFRIPAGARSYFEYRLLESAEPTYSLTWMENNSNQDLMLPSGPFGQQDTYSDFKSFVDGQRPENVNVEPACHPVSASICEVADSDIPVRPAINGQCGTAHGNHGAYAAQGNVPAAHFCSAGITQNVSQSAAEITWTCGGRDGAVDSASSMNCSVFRPQNATCGTATSATGYYNSAAIPAAAFCGIGNRTGVSQTATQISWTCQGLHGGNNISCSVPRSIDGTCGSHDGTSRTSAPSGGNLCNNGAATSVSGSGPWTWSCQGQNGGSDTSCQAARTGQCGSANGTPVSSAPSGGNLCAVGTATSVSGSGPWSWNCNGLGSGAAAVSCSAPAILAGSCTNFPGQHASQPANAGNGCSVGNYANDTDTGAYFRWRCNGVNGGDPAYCGAQKTAPAVDAVCRSYVGSYAEQPANNNGTGCLQGTYANMSNTASQFRWTCNGQNGGSNATCTAPIMNTTVNGSCGAAHGNHNTYENITQISAGAFCNAGNAINKSDNSNTITWTCAGASGGSNQNCTVNKDCTEGGYGPWGPETIIAGWDGEVGAGCFQLQWQMQNLGNPWQCGSPQAEEDTTCWTTQEFYGGGGNDCNTAYAFNVYGRQRSVTPSTCQAYTPPVNGVCGSGHNTTRTSQPTGTAACSNGNFADVSNTASQFRWSCQGTNGGSSVSCNANIAPPPAGSGCFDACGNSRQNNDMWCAYGGMWVITPMMKCVNGVVEQQSAISGIGCDSGGEFICQ